MEKEALIVTDLYMGKIQRAAGWIPVRYVFAFLSSLGMMNIYAMRINLSIAMVAMVNSTNDGANKNNGRQVNTTSSPSAQGEFHWNEYEQGIILGAFFWGYIVTQLPGGRLAEIYSAKWVFGGGVLWTAVFTFLTPLAARAGYWYLIALRVSEGLGEGVTFPAMNVMVAKWSPPCERSRMVTVVYAGSLLGTVVGLLLCSSLINSGLAGGWPSVFYACGGIGVAWFVVWCFLAFDSPDKHPWISQQEKDFITNSLGYTKDFIKKSSPFPFKKAMKSPAVWGIIVAHFCNNWGFYTLLTDLPTYLSKMLDFNINQNGFYSALPYLLTWLFGIACSALCDHLIKNGYLSTTVARRLFNLMGHLFPAIFLFSITRIGHDSMLTYALLVAAMTSSGACYGGYASNHIDIASHFSGTLFGITNTIATIPGWMGPYVVGAFTNGNNTMQAWNNVFYLSSGLYMVSVILFSVLGQGEEQPWNKVIKHDEDMTVNSDHVRRIT